MCGIAGIIYYFKDSKKELRKILRKAEKLHRAISHRGRDGYGLLLRIYYKNKKQETIKLYSRNIKELYTNIKNMDLNKDIDYIVILLHSLHSIVNYVPQPIEKGEKIIIGNTEIYNYKQLSRKARNDTEAILYSNLKDLDGQYAIALLQKDKLTIYRDLIGINPLWYSHIENELYIHSAFPIKKDIINKENLKEFYFASEKQALLSIGIYPRELNPRSWLEINLKNKKLKRHFRSLRDSLKIEINNNYGLEELSKREIEQRVNEIRNTLINAVKKRIPKQEFAILFSGGLDSTLIARIAKEVSKNFYLIYVYTEKDKDYYEARRIAKQLGIKLITRKAVINKQLIKRIIKYISTNNPVKIEVGLVTFTATSIAKKKGIKVMLTGIGADDLFIGYNRQKKYPFYLGKDSYSNILSIYEKDLYRDNVLAFRNGVELRHPFLDKELVKKALMLPNSLKIGIDQYGFIEKGKRFDKFILRIIAQEYGLMNKNKPKKAAQYSTKISKYARRIIKHYPSIFNNNELSEYFSSLISTGKDGWYAFELTKNRGYKPLSILTMHTKNKDSYFFHSPNTNLASIQAELCNISIIEQETKGERDKELIDLYKLVKKAILQGTEMISSGAILSTYQRDRVQLITEILGVKSLTPIWHTDQEQMIRAMIKKNYEFLIVKTCAEGIHRFIGKIITKDNIEEFLRITNKYRISPVGEGGEYESLLLKAPFFNGYIKIKDLEIRKEEDQYICLIKDFSIQGKKN